MLLIKCEEQAIHHKQPPEYILLVYIWVYLKKEIQPNSENN